ncbi:MAG: hypothetical protein H0W83_03010 [Planctomycetes bacterium]|nr:hypothetical protein [Planctomycetota bacterium]
MRLAVTVLVVLAAIAGAVAIGYQLRIRGPVPEATSRAAGNDEAPAAVAPADHAIAPSPEDPASTRPLTTAAAPRAEKPVRPTWTLRDERDFTIAADVPTSPWYDTDVTATTKSGVYGASGQYENVTALVVPATRDRERSFALGARIPHAVKWELTIIDPSRDEQGNFSGYQNKTVEFDDEGLCISAAPPDAAMPLGENEVVIERSGGRLRCSLNGLETAVFAVAEDDRQPLRVGAIGFSVAITRSRVYLARDEDLADAPRAAASPATGPRWEPALREPFDSAGSIDRIALWGTGSDIQWWQPKQALMIGTTPQQQEAYAAIHGSFPGDIRVSFRALREKSARDVSIGLFFSCDGIAAMDGYFAEWARGGCQLKKRKHIRSRVQAPTPATPDRWVRCELTSVGGAITMKLEERTVLSWTDPHPLQGARHDLACFYVWADNTLIDDLLIERNGNDPTQPLPDDPALPDRIGDGRPKAAAPDGHENF